MIQDFPIPIFVPLVANQVLKQSSEAHLIIRRQWANVAHCPTEPSNGGYPSFL